MTSQVPVIRTSIRAILLTPQNEVMMIQIGNHSSPWEGWITPGGGMEPGESDESALRREMREELGLTNFKIEGQLWTRFHKFVWSNQAIEQSERFYLIRVDKFTPAPEIDPAGEEMLGFKGFRWWSIDDIESSKDEFAPREIASALRRYLREGLPTTPFPIS